MMDIFINEAGDKANFSIGILVMEDVQNVSSENKLSLIKQELEDTIRAKYYQTTREELKALHAMDSYISYYKKFGYTYHVLPQLESVIKGKTIPSGLPLVEAMFMAELKNMLLTAGHDLDKTKVPLSLRVSTGNENFTALNGKNVTTVPGDLIIADQKNVISSILRGPDQRTSITEHTTRVIYTVYAPFGIKEHLVREHLNDIEWYVRLFSEGSVTYLKRIF